MKKNRHIGSNLDSFLKEEGIFDECKEEVVRRYRSYKEHLIEKLKDSEYASSYLDACLEESLEAKDVGIFQLAIRDNEFEKTEAQIFFRFLTQIGIVPLIGACSEVHMKQDLDIFNFQLPQSTIQAIELLL